MSGKLHTRVHACFSSVGVYEPGLRPITIIIQLL